MDYTSIHIYGHLLSDDILHEIETESSMQGNREQDFNLDVSLTAKIDNAWSSLRNDWKLFSERNSLRDPYGTKAVRRLMERFFSSLDYQLDYQPTQIEVGERKFDIPYICPERDATRFGSFTFLYRLPMNVFLAVWLVAISQIGFCIGSRVLLSTTVTMRSMPSSFRIFLI